MDSQFRGGFILYYRRSGFMTIVLNLNPTSKKMSSSLHSFFLLKTFLIFSRLT